MFKNKKLGAVLLMAYLEPFKLQADFARENAQEVACLASMGYISTAEEPGKFGRKWRITGLGLEQLQHLQLIWPNPIHG